MLAVPGHAAPNAAADGDTSDEDETVAEAQMEVLLTADRSAIQSIIYSWRFDAPFSAQMLESYDDNADGALNAAELREASQGVHDTIEPYHYFLLASQNGKEMPVRSASQRAAAYKDGRLDVSFVAHLAEPVKLSGRFEIGLYDPTFSIDFATGNRFSIAPDLPARCSKRVVHPDFDEILEKNPDALADDPERDPEGLKTITLFASRIEIDCKP